MENEKLPENNLKDVSGGYMAHLEPETLKSIDKLYLDPREYSLMQKAGYIKNKNKMNKEKLKEALDYLYIEGFNYAPELDKNKDKRNAKEIILE